MSIRTGVVAPTINLEDPEEECDLNFTALTAQERPVRFALNNSFGFGGHNASLVIGAF
jgi:3-oxoacyl-[acyl-carrier-protein] synthase II